MANMVILTGRLGKDPELRYTRKGTPVANFSMATASKWVKDGEPKEKTEWHLVEAWGKRGETLEKYLGKGDRVYIEGSLHTSPWEPAKGVTAYKTVVRVDGFEFLTPKKAKKKD